MHGGRRCPEQPYLKSSRQFLELTEGFNRGGDRENVSDQKILPNVLPKKTDPWSSIKGAVVEYFLTSIFFGCGSYII